MPDEFRKTHRVGGLGEVLFKGMRGQITNISRNGVAVQTEENLEELIGTSCLFIIDFAKSDIFQEDTHFEIVGTIRRCAVEEKGGFYTAGVELDSITEEQQDALDQFLVFQWDSQLFWDD